MVDDWSEWLEEVDDVKPLKGKKKAELPAETKNNDNDLSDNHEEELIISKGPTPAQLLLEKFKRKQKEQPEGMHHKDTTRADHMSGTRASVDEKTRRKLMKGNFALDARLDLHGMTVDEARRRTDDILERCAKSGARVLLLVHGKGTGYGNKGNMGAIKSQVTDWLIDSPHVLAFHSAKPKHGGVGALYVLIRRPRG